MAATWRVNHAARSVLRLSYRPWRPGVAQAAESTTLDAMRFSRRSAFDPRENALTLALREARRSGREIVDLTTSNPTTAGLPYDAAGVLDPLRNEDTLRYTPEPFGLPSARASVAAVLGVEPGRVVLTASTSEAYAMLLAVLCDPGDRVLAPRPSYPLLAHLAELSGVALTPYPLRFDGRWHVDPPSVLSGAQLGARAVLAVSPNNPTGSVLDAEDLRALDAAGLPVVVDEVFGAYPLEGRWGSAYSLDHPVLVVGGLSKLGLPQMKVGWIAVGGGQSFAQELLSRLELVADTYLSLSTPAQLALPRWLESRGPIVAAIRERTSENLAALRRLLPDESPITVPPVEAGWYACLRVPRSRTDEAWALRLLEADGVLVQPGYFYDFEDEGWLVVSLLTEGEAFREGATRLIARIGREG